MILKKGKAIPQDPQQMISPDIEQTDKLVALAKNGDDTAFGRLVELYEKFVYNTALRTLTAAGYGSSDADDIAQASFLKAWRSLSAFRGDCTFSTWLFRITVNTAKDHIRSHIRHETVSLTVEDGEGGEDYVADIPLIDGNDIPEEALEKKELILAVRRAIDGLPEDQKTVIILRDINELPYNDIAERLNIEIGTVKSRINRGRQALKKLLSEQNLF